MHDSQTEGFTESILEIVGVLYRWRKKILFFTLGITLLVALGSLLVPNYYESRAVFYAANDQATSKSVMFGNEGGVSEIGGEDLVERLISFATSRDLTDHMVKKFNLFKHYDIDSTSAKGLDKARKRFQSHFSVLKNEYGAVEMTLEDKDKELTLPMIKEAIRKVDEMYQATLHLSKSYTINSFEEMMVDVRNRLNIVKDSLTHARRFYGIYNIESQSESMSSAIIDAEGNLAESKTAFEVLKNANLRNPDTLAYIEARLKGAEQKYKMLTTPDPKAMMSLSKLTSGRELIEYLDNERYILMLQLRDLAAQYSQFKTSSGVKKSLILPVENPEAPKVKSRPKRSIYVLAAFVLSFMVAVMGALIAESSNKINWKEILKD